MTNINNININKISNMINRMFNQSKSSSNIKKINNINKSSYFNNKINHFNILLPKSTPKKINCNFNSINSKIYKINSIQKNKKPNNYPIKSSLINLRTYSSKNKIKIYTKKYKSYNQIFKKSNNFTMELILMR